MRRVGLLALLALLAACAGRREAAAPEPAAASALPGLPFGELPPQTLVRGQCALVLWSRTAPARRIFMGLNEPASARVSLAGRTAILPRTGGEGEAAYGHQPVQTYAGEGLTLTVRAEFAAREGLVAGAAVPNAVLSVRAADGAETVIPTAGLLACQS